MYRPSMDFESQAAEKSELGLVGDFSNPSRLFPFRHLISNADIEAVEAEMLSMEQLEMPLDHDFCDGLYLRTILMPAGARVIGHEHKTRHFNLIVKGRCSVISGDQVHEIVAPYKFISEPGVRKILKIHEETVWMTMHLTDETDIPKIEDALRIKSESFKAHERLLHDAATAV